jgi:hypothetical protein
MRSVVWEGHVAYPTVDKTAEGKLVSRTLRLEGPTGLITTTTKGLEPELETRLLRASVPDTPAATRAILRAQAQRAAGQAPETPDLAPWHAAQWWLERHGIRSVVIPYAEQLAELIPATQVRLRRDHPQLLALVATHALLHQRQRERDSLGRVVATLADYVAVYRLVAPLYEAVASGGLTRAVREAVEIVHERCAGDPERAVTVGDVAQALKVDRSSASRRINAAIRLGYLVNLETRRGYRARLRPGDPLPDLVAVLPDPATLQNHDASPERNSATLPDFCDPDAAKLLQSATATPLQQCTAGEGECCTVAKPLQSAGATVFCDRDAETGGPLQCCGEDERDEHVPTDARLLAALRQRGRAPLWELAWECGLGDVEAIAAAQRLLDAGMIHRVGDDRRAPLSAWSELALVKEAQP